MAYTTERDPGAGPRPAVTAVAQGGDRVAPEDLEALRPMLVSVAFRILGSAADAQDAVQDTLVRMVSSAPKPVSLRAYLVTATTRSSIDLLRARRRRQEQLGCCAALVAAETLAPQEDPERVAESAAAVAGAARMLLERLTALELAVFVLREVLGFDFDDVAVTIRRSPEACRQLAVRARRHLRTESARFVAVDREWKELAAALLDALVRGDLRPVRTLLAARTAACPARGERAVRDRRGVAA